ncbi:hypothetical protein [Thauera sp. Sel9]|uniref:hypothetical protein n=1 Tax=Thauera sp. Sel9 TaxID=2974299 RepID=UPI0021E137A6|nr:hypothetical protein [Thauera sp. Sel9]MCV2218890.1 hypothetical protein [Thauera sp. Sel9]
MTNLKTRLAKLEQATPPENDGTIVVITDQTGAAIKMTRNGLPYTGRLEGMRRIIVPAKLPAVVETRHISAQERRHDET